MNREARSWEFLGPRGSWGERLYERLRRALNARLVDQLLARTNRNATATPSQPPGLRALEAGSGTGYASSLLARRDEVGLSVCLDIDEDALREARRRDPSLPVVVGDMLRMPFADDAFDLVFSNSTVEHLDDPGLAVAEMRRTCRTHGTVFIGVPYRFGPLAFQPLIARTSLGIWLGRVFSVRGLQELMRRAGLAPCHSIRYFLRVFVGVMSVKPWHSMDGRAGEP